MKYSSYRKIHLINSFANDINFVFLRQNSFYYYYMALVNEHFLKLPDSYFFSDLVKKANSFKVTHPKTHIIDLGSGDVLLPLPQVAINAMHKAADEFTDITSFHGYSPRQGYPFLIDAIIKNDYLTRGVALEPSEIFINDGARTDIGNIGDILRHDNSIGVTDPIHPCYIESNAMCGRAGSFEANGQWSNVVYLPCTLENHFIPQIPSHRIDIIYLCYPNDPTGAVMNKAELKKWVNYALENDALIMYDSTYEAYIQNPDIPHSIYEIKGAKKVAIEFRSFSKTAGFTGVRCGYTIIPKEVTASTLKGDRIALNKLWNRHRSIKFNGASYISQRSAEALYTTEGKKQVKEYISYYMHNALIMKEMLSITNLNFFGGDNAPFFWIKAPNNLTSWQFFDTLLYEAHVIGTPGIGFGQEGNGYLRLTAFNTTEQCKEAMSRIQQWARQ